MQAEAEMDANISNIRNNTNNSNNLNNPNNPNIPNNTNNSNNPNNHNNTYIHTCNAMQAEAEMDADLDAGSGGRWYVPVTKESVGLQCSIGLFS